VSLVVVEKSPLKAKFHYASWLMEFGFKRVRSVVLLSGAVQVCGDPGVVPPGRYRRGSVSHSWSETVVSSNSTAAAGASPERLYTPVDELLSSAERQVRAAADRPGSAVTDDGPYSSSSASKLFTADYSDTRQSLRPPYGIGEAIIFLTCGFFLSFFLLVHGQVTIIFVVSVCLFACAEFLSAVFDPISMKLGHMLHVWV